MLLLGADSLGFSTSQGAVLSTNLDQEHACPWVPPWTLFFCEKLGKAACHSSALSHQEATVISTPSHYKMIRFWGFSLTLQPNITLDRDYVWFITGPHYICLISIYRASGHLDIDTEETERVIHEPGRWTRASKCNEVWDLRCHIEKVREGSGLHRSHT